MPVVVAEANGCSRLDGFLQGVGGDGGSAYRAEGVDFLGGRAADELPRLAAYGLQFLQGA